MTRPLGSFNRRVNLPDHKEDHRPIREQRIAALRRDSIPEERNLNRTGEEKFVRSRGRAPVQRFAGQALSANLNATGQTTKYTSGLQQPFVAPPMGAAENRTSSTTGYIG